MRVDDNANESRPIKYIDCNPTENTHEESENQHCVAPSDILEVASAAVFSIVVDIVLLVLDDLLEVAGELVPIVDDVIGIVPSEHNN